MKENTGVIGVGGGGIGPREHVTAFLLVDANNRTATSATASLTDGTNVMIVED